MSTPDLRDPTEYTAPAARELRAPADDETAFSITWLDPPESIDGCDFDSLADYMTGVFQRKVPWPKSVRLTHDLWHECQRRLGTESEVTETKPGRFLGGPYRLVGVPIILDDTADGWAIDQ